MKIDFRHFDHGIRSTVSRWITGNGGNGARIVINWRVPDAASVVRPESSDRIDPSVAPWLWPVQDYRVQSYPIDDRLLFVWDKNADGAYTRYPLRTTAGTEMVATAPRTQRQVTFSYNVQAFDETNISSWVGKVNNAPVRIAGVDYPELTVVLQNMVAAPSVIKEGDAGGNDVVKWRFVKIDVSLIVDPKTHNREYLNMSTYAIMPDAAGREKNGYTQIWTCEITRGAGDNAYLARCFGSREQILKELEGTVSESERSSAQAVTEPMFLDANGWIMDWNPVTLELTNLIQEPQYRVGCPNEPIDFAQIRLPVNRGGA